MKKAFIEPDMKVIKLNLNENIATSSYKETSGFNLIYDINSETDLVINTFSKKQVDDAAYEFFYGVKPDSIQSRAGAIDGIVTILGNPAVADCLSYYWV